MPWLLANQVLEDRLDILIYCHRPNKVSGEPTPALRGHNYLVPGAVTNWVNEAIALEQLCGGLFGSGKILPCFLMRPVCPVRRTLQALIT